MKKALLSVFTLLLFISCSNEEAKTENSLTEKNEHRGCASHEVLEEQLKNDPGLASRMQQIENLTSNAMSQGRLVNGKIEIPVVVNVLYKTSSENISISQIQSQIDVLNEEKQTMGGLTVKEQAIREFVYDWQKNSKLIVYQASDGKLKFLDATTFDPFQMIDRLVNGFMQSKTGLDIVKGTFQENLQTFASLDFVIDAAITSYESYKRKGSQDVFKDLLQPFFSRAMAPGAVLQIEDAIGKELVSGRNVKEAKPLKLIGYRDYDIDVEKQLYFNLEPERAKQLAKKRSYRGDIYNLIEKLENSQMFTNSDLDNIVKSYKQVNQSRKDSWMFVLDQVLSALILGANPENIKRTLQGNKIGFSKKEVDALFNLGFIPLKVNPLAKQKNKSEMEKALQF